VEHDVSCKIQSCGPEARHDRSTIQNDRANRWKEHQVLSDPLPLRLETSQSLALLRKVLC
jgi:hypothetical protein